MELVFHLTKQIVISCTIQPITLLLVLLHSKLAKKISIKFSNKILWNVLELKTKKKDL